MRYFRQVSVRLFLLLTVLLVGAFAIYVHLNYSVHRQHLEQRLEAGANRYSQLILRSTRQAMMENSRFHLEQIISAIGESPQVEAVRIYNKSGEIVVSTNPAELGHRVDRKAEACAACHVGPDLREVVPTEELARQLQSPEGVPILGFISPIRNEPSCHANGCHFHPPDQRILGVLDLQLSLEQDIADLRTSRLEMIRDGVIVTLVTAAGAWIFITLVVRRPVRRLIKGTKSVARLDLDVKLNVSSEDEIGELARNFDKMAAALRKAQAENLQWGTALEAKVEEKTRELREAQAHLVHVEKMASLGKLSAIVAHEINNPLAGVLTYARLVRRKLAKGGELSAKDRERLLEHLEMIESETTRCGEIVKNMLLFSRRKPEGLAQVRLAQVVDRAVRLVRHGCEMSQVDLQVHQAEMDDQIVCNADQIQQMLVALMVNANEAMADGGTLLLEVKPSKEDGVTIRVQDTGPGIPADLQHRIFEPFFTTKEGESGLGLGLAVVHGIVESHGGKITVQSGPGEGTTFQIVLPRRPPEEAGTDQGEAT